MTNVKLARISDAPTRTMRLGRGVTHFLVGPDDGARAVDLHMNVINIDSGLGPYHYHSNAENVYVVLEGVAEVVVEGEGYFLVEGDVVFLPPGVRHAAGSAGTGAVKVLEIYAPAGQDFNIVDMPESVVRVARPEIEHLLPETLQVKS